MAREATTGWAAQKTTKAGKVWVARWVKENGKTGERKCKSQTEAKKVAAQMTAAVAELKERKRLDEGATLTPKAAGVGQPSPLTERTVLLRGYHNSTQFGIVVDKYEVALKRGYNGAAPLKANTLNGYRKHHNYWCKVFDEYAEDGIPWVEAARTVRDAMLDEVTNKRAKFGRKTAKAKFEQLKRVCRYAVAEGMIQDDPTAGQEIKLATVEEKIRAKVIKKEAAYRPDEIAKLIKAADEMCEDMTIDARSRNSWRKTYRPLLHVLIQSGIRMGEARALTRANVDFKRGSIHVEAAADYADEVDTPKSANAVREIHLPPATMEHLKQCLKWHRHPFVFAARSGKVRAYNVLRKFMLLPLCERAKVKPRGFHGFRHHLASQYIANGANVLKLSQLLGHHTPSFTMDVYAHFFEDSDTPPLDLAQIVQKPAA